MVDDSRRHYPPPGLGAILAAGRRRRSMSQRDLAAAAGISAGYVAMLETEQRAPSESVAAALIEALRLSGDDLLVLLDAAIPDVGRDWPGAGRSERYRGA